MVDPECLWQPFFRLYPKVAPLLGRSGRKPMGWWGRAYSLPLLQKATPNTRPPLCLGEQSPHSITLPASRKRKQAALALATSAIAEAEREAAGRVGGRRAKTHALGPRGRLVPTCPQCAGAAAPGGGARPYSHPPLSAKPPPAVDARRCVGPRPPKTL